MLGKLHKNENINVIPTKYESTYVLIIALGEFIEGFSVSLETYPTDSKPETENIGTIIAIEKI